MGIGRREFLQIFGSLLATLATRTSDAICLSDDVYVNRKLGIGFSKPSGWKFVDVKDMGTVKKGQLLDVDDPDLADFMLASLDLPFVAVAPLAEPTARQTRCAQFYLASHPDEDQAADRVLGEILQSAFGRKSVNRNTSEFTLPMKKARQDWQGCRELLSEFRVSSLPQATRLSNCDAAEYTASYLFEHVELPAPRRIRVRTLAVQHHDLFYLIRLIDAQEYAFDFSEFLSSIRLV